MIDAGAGLPRTVDVLIVGGGATGVGLLRDLARRGLRCLLVDKGDLGTGTSGRYHGLLHSGARYVAKDPLAARECIDENAVLRRIAPACIEDTGGLFVATPDDPDDYVQAFAERCAASRIPCDEVPVADVLRREPAVNPGIRRAFAVPDASLEPWQLIAANLADARGRGSDALPYRQVVAMERNDAFITSVEIADVRTGTVDRVSARMVVSAAGAWAGRIAGLAGIRLDMSPGKGTMLIFNQRMTDTCINRCHVPADGDIMVPVHTVAILGTTDIKVPDPDHYDIGHAEIEKLLTEGEKLFPDIRRKRILRAYAGVRPLYSAEENAAGEDREISRAHVVIDHERRDGCTNLVSIVGGKVTTYRLMAEQTADLVCQKLGVTIGCTTADEILPGQGATPTYYWLGHRLAEHEHEGGGDAALICECEFVTRPMLERFLAANWPCSLDDVRRGTRLGMGPCQGAFCTFRAAGVVADHVAAGTFARAPLQFVAPPMPTYGPAGNGASPNDGPPIAAEGPAQAGSADAGMSRVAATDWAVPRTDGAAATTDGAAPTTARPAATDDADPRANAARLAEAALVAFLRERYKGTRPIAWGRQLQELWLATGIYWGTLGVDAFAATADAVPVMIPEQASAHASH